MHLHALTYHTLARHALSPSTHKYSHLHTHTHTMHPPTHTQAGRVEREERKFGFKRKRNAHGSTTNEEETEEESICNVETQKDHPSKRKKKETGLWFCLSLQWPHTLVTWRSHDSPEEAIEACWYWSQCLLGPGWSIHQSITNNYDVIGFKSTSLRISCLITMRLIMM